MLWTTTSLSSDLVQVWGKCEVSEGRRRQGPGVQPVSSRREILGFTGVHGRGTGSCPVVHGYAPDGSCVHAFSEQSVKMAFGYETGWQTSLVSSQVVNISGFVGQRSSFCPVALCKLMGAAVFQ